MEDFTKIKMERQILLTFNFTIRKSSSKFQSKILAPWARLQTASEHVSIKHDTEWINAGEF